MCVCVSVCRIAINRHHLRSEGMGGLLDGVFVPHASSPMPYRLGESVSDTGCHQGTADRLARTQSGPLRFCTPLPRPMRFLVLTAALVLAGCSAADLSGGLDVQADPPTLRVENETSGTVRYVAFEANAAASLDLASPDQWPALAAGERAALAYDAIGVDPGDTEAIVYWWAGGDVQVVRVAL